MAGFSLLYVQLSRFLFSLAERTRLAFSPQDMAAKRYLQAHFRAAKNNFRNCKSEFLNRAVENLDQLCREFLKLFSKRRFRCFLKSFRKTWFEKRNKNETQTLCVNSA